MNRRKSETRGRTPWLVTAFLGLPSGTVFDLFQEANDHQPALVLDSACLSICDEKVVCAVVIDGCGRSGLELRALLSSTSIAFPEARLILFVDTWPDTLFVEEHLNLHAVLKNDAEVCRLTWAIEDTHRLYALLDSHKAMHDTGEPAGEQMMVGGSKAMREVFRMVRCFAATDVPVLITGESGTGKELVARAIHERSAYAGGPFVPINCGGIPSELIASELFGHEKGAFTGARETKLGRIETAANGTLFLDEIGDLPLALQAHLLRFLQDGTIERVGGLKTINVPTRIVAGTNVDLDKAIEEGRFRADLFYRLNVLRIMLPPLRARDDDAVLIAHHLLQLMREGHGKPKAVLSPAAISAIRAYAWPGNVRELISALRRGLTMCRRSKITATDLGISAGTSKNQPPTLDQARSMAERDAIEHALQHSNYRMRDAARTLAVSHVTLYSLVKKHNLSSRYEGRSASQRQSV